MGTFLSRRVFLASTGITVASVITRQAGGQNPPARATTPGVRENVANMEEDHPELKSYRKAIAAMQKLQDSNPLSWQFQANMHGVTAGGGQNADWSWCMHGNWWFLPWHRGHLYFFERIIRKMSGDDAFRLPY